MSFYLPSRLPNVGTTIFTAMSRCAAEHGAINLSQGVADPVSVFKPDGEYRRVIRFCFAKNEATLAAAGERWRSQ